MMDLYDASRHKSKSREGSVSKSKEGSVTESPAYTPSGSPQVTGSPPSKKKVERRSFSCLYQKYGRTSTIHQKFGQLLDYNTNMSNSKKFII